MDNGFGFERLSPVQWDERRRPMAVGWRPGRAGSLQPTAAKHTELGHPKKVAG